MDYPKYLIPDYDVLEHNYRFRLTKCYNKLLETGVKTFVDGYGDYYDDFVVRLTRYYYNYYDEEALMYIDVSMDTYMQIVSMVDHINNRFDYEISGKFFENDEIRMWTQKPMPDSGCYEHLLCLQSVEDDTMIYMIQSTYRRFVKYQFDVEEQYECFENEYFDEDFYYDEYDETEWDEDDDDDYDDYYYYYY